MTQATTADAPVPAHRDHTVTLTTAQALVRYLQAQTSVRDGAPAAPDPRDASASSGTATSHGIGQALDEYRDELPFFQGRNEQSMVHTAAAFAKASRRSPTLAVHRLDRPGRDEHDHRRRRGDDQPAAGAAAPRRHLRDAPPGPGAAAARASHRAAT